MKVGGMSKFLRRKKKNTNEWRKMEHRIENDGDRERDTEEAMQRKKRPCI